MNTTILKLLSGVKLMHGDVFAWERWNNYHMVTKEELRQAQFTILAWFLEQQPKEDKMPITVLDAEIVDADGHSFRLITHLSFYRRNELPSVYNELE